MKTGQWFSLSQQTQPLSTSGLQYFCSLTGVKKGEGRGREEKRERQKKRSLLSPISSPFSFFPSPFRRMPRCQLFVVPISRIILAVSRPFHASFSRNCSCLNFRQKTSSKTRACYADCIVNILKLQLFHFYLVEHFTPFQANIDSWDGIAAVQWQTTKFLQVCVLGVKWIP